MADARDGAPRLRPALLALAVVGLLASCAGVKEGPPGQPTGASVNPQTGSRGGNR